MGVHVVYIKVANSARIQADVITNQRNVMTFGDDRNYGAIAGTGGNISAGDLALISRTDINNNGGSLTAKDSLLLDAQGDIHLNALELKRRSQAGKNVTESTDYLLSQLNAGGDATFKAGGDINSQAAQAKIGGNGIFDATNINLLGVTERDYSKTVKKKKGTFSSSKKTVEQENLNFVGSDFQIGGNMVMNAENDITMVGANVDVGKSAAIKAGNDITLTAGISTDKYSKQKSGSGVATTSSQQKGHVTETATGTMIKTGESLQIDSDGGNVTILASELNAKENLVLGDMNVKRDENGAPIKDENGQYITEDGSSINNLTIGTVELKDESWNVKTSGLKGPLKDLAAAAAFTLSASGIGQMAMAAGLDTEIEVGKTSETRIESTTHATSTINAGDTLAIRTDGDFRVEGSQANATKASIETRSTTITAVENTTQTTESESTHTVGATKAALKKDEVTVAGTTETKHKETTTTTDTELVKAGLNVSENLAMNSVENIDILGSDVNVGGNAEAKAKTITVAGLKEQTTTEHKEKTETTTTSVGVKNAYVDTAYAIQAVADAGAALDAAQSALDQAKRDVKNGTLQANAIGDYEANLAAATTQLTQATLSAAASGAAAAATTGTGGFYATGSAEKTITEKTSTSTEERYIGSNFNVGGDASFDATDSIDIVGSNMDIAGGLALNAKDVTIKAGTEETTSTSSETTRTAGTSYSTNGSGSVNASGSNTDADSYSKTHINSTINAGSLTSTSDNLTLSGANVEVAGGIDIDTGNLTIESLQDESSSSSKTEGYSVGAGVSATSMNPSALGANENSSEANSQWVNNQTTLIGGTSGEGDVNISADKTTITGSVLASATRNEDGSLTDNSTVGTGSLNLATDELIIEDLKDKDHSENRGFDISAGLSSSGSSTVGLTSDGHKTEQNTLATLGGGNITKKDGSEHEDGLVESANSDLNNSQEITKDQQTGGLNATVTVDHRLLSESGRDKISEDFMKADMLLEAVERVVTTERVGITDLNSEIGKQNNTYEAIKLKIAKDPVLASKLQDPSLSAEDKQQVLNQLTHTVMAELGYETEGYENKVTADENSIRQGFYSEETGDSYINDEHIDSTGELVETAGHEMAHAMDSQDGSTQEYTQEYTQEDRETYAHSLGEGLANYTDQALDISGYDEGMASSNNHVGSDSKTVKNNNEEYAGLDKSKGDSFLTPEEERNRDEAMAAPGCNSRCQTDIFRGYKNLDDRRDVERYTAQAQQIGQNIVDAGSAVIDAGSAVIDAVISPVDTASEMIDGIANITPSSIIEGLNAVAEDLNTAADEQHQQHVDRAEAFVEGDSEKLGQAEGNIASDNLAGLTLPGGVGVVGKVIDKVNSGDRQEASSPPVIENNPGNPDAEAGNSAPLISVDSSFTTNGVDPANPMAQDIRSDLYREYKASGVSDELAQRLADGNIGSGSSIPTKRIVDQDEELYKFVPSGNAPGRSSYYFTKSEYEEFSANPEKLAQKAGLPYKNFVGQYDVYSINPKTDKTPVVFESKVAEIQEGAYQASGGANQTIVPNLKDWNEPVKLEQIKVY